MSSTLKSQTPAPRAGTSVSNLGFQSALIAVLLVAAWFRAFRLDTVPPGPHHDAIINGQIVDEFIWPALPAWMRPEAVSSIPWLTLQANPNGPDLQEHAWLYQVSLAASLGAIGRNLIGLRFADFAWGMLGVCASYALARRLFGRRAAGVAMAVQAVSLWSVMIERSGLRAGTIVPLLALAGCAFWDAWQRSWPATLFDQKTSGLATAAGFALSGALFSLAVYGYLGARPMVFVFLMFAVYLGLTRRLAWKKLLSSLVAFLVSAALVIAPHVLYLWTHPAENLRISMLSSPLNELAAGRPAAILQSALATLGMFFWRGDSQWQYNVAGRPVFDLVGGLCFVVGVGLALWRWRRPAYAFALMWLPVSLLPGMLSLPAPHWLRTVAAQPITFALVSLGALELARTVSTRLRVLAYAGVALWLFGFAAWSYQGVFDVWARNDEVRFLYQGAITEMARYLDQHSDTSPVAACSVFLNEHEDFLRSPRETLAFILRRGDLTIRWFDCRDSLVIPAGGRARLMFPAVIPYSSTLDVALWPWMNASVPVHAEGLPDGTLYTLDATPLLAREIVSLTQSSQVQWSPETGMTGAALLPVNFDHRLELIGYRVEKAQRQAGKDVRVLLYWRVLRKPLPLFLKSFTHLLSDPNHVVEQNDRQALLTDTLQPGDVFIQVHTLTIPPVTPAGQYRLSIGWYSELTGQRLTVYDGDSPRGNRLMLQEITVKP